MTAANGGPGESPHNQGYEAPPLEQSPPYGAYPPPPSPPPGTYPPPPPIYAPPPEFGVGYPGGYGWPATPPPGNNPLAVFALVSSLVGLLCGVGSVIGIVLGVIALNQVKRSGQQGRGLAIAGIAVGAVSLIISLFVMTLAVTQTNWN